jgi:hypothetical protein
MFLSFDSKEMALVENEFSEMSATLAKKDSLFQIVSRTTAFKVDESTLTLLLSALQTVFPEGVAAEEIIISELDNKSWRLTISAFTESASFIQKVIDEMQKIKGLSGARMVSSEQATEKDISIGTRFKIEALWR